MGIMVIKNIPCRWWQFWKWGKVGNFHGPKYVPRQRREKERHTMAPEGMNWEDHRNYHREISQANAPTARDPLRALRDIGEMAADSNTTDEATNGQLTGQERTLLEINAVVWNGFGQLPKQYHTDINDMRHHIDAINNIILARAASRANPDLVRR